MATVERPIPLLTEGQRLSRDEFLRRWDAHPEIKFAELIGGVVFMPSPVGFEHGDQENDAAAWVAYYKAWTPGTAGGNNSTILLLEDAPQADVNLRVLPEFGGRSTREGKLLGGTPEFFVEVCHSSTAYNLHEKLELYEAAGIPEYLAILLREQEIRWHVLENGVYQIMQPDSDGIWRSRVFPGLWLDGKAFLAGKLAQVLTKLDEGLKSPEHQAFVEKLKAARR